MNRLIEQALSCEKENHFSAAIEYWKKALEEGEEEGKRNGMDCNGDSSGVVAYRMGHAYILGIGVESNLKRACTLFTHSARAGHCGGLAMCHFLGTEEFKKDWTRSLELFTQMVIHEMDTIAYFSIGCILGMMRNTNYDPYITHLLDPTIITIFLTRAALAGHPVAMLKLSVLYEDEQKTGIGQDYAASINYLKAAAALGYPEAQYRYGFFLQYEVRNAVDALPWYQKAMENNHSCAMFEVASLYESGQVVEKNLDEAKRLYALSASCESNIKNQLRIAKEFADGLYSNPNMSNASDYAEARRRFRFAAEHGCAESMRCLSQCYETGAIGTPTNLHSAFLWLERAAHSEHSSFAVSMHLAEWYQYGKGVARDLHEAIYWYNHALSKIQSQEEHVHMQEEYTREVMVKYNKLMKALRLEIDLLII